MGIYGGAKLRIYDTKRAIGSRIFRGIREIVQSGDWNVPRSRNVCNPRGEFTRVYGSFPKTSVFARPRFVKTNLCINEEIDRAAADARERISI